MNGIRGLGPPFEFSNSRGPIELTGRFGRLFPHLRPLEATPQELVNLALAMVERNAGNSSFDNRAIPAGYTYLGQFITHDLTFDATSVAGRAIDPAFLTSFRTPALDLDSLYGAGPNLQPFLFRPETGNGRSHGPTSLLRFRLGKVSRAAGSPAVLRRRRQLRLESATDDPELDLTRVDGVALIPDPRNDETLILSQLHVLFSRFHNAVADLLAAPGSIEPELDIARARPLTREGLAAQHAEAPRRATRPPAVTFEDVRRVVIWHYQWIVLHDFLRQVVDREVLADVLQNGPRLFRPRQGAFLPIEFTAAAFRFGHSQIREQYDINSSRSVLNGNGDRGPLGLEQLFKHREFKPGLSQISEDLVIDWSRFFRLLDSSDQAFNWSRNIDPFLGPSLHRLFEGLNPLGERTDLSNLKEAHALALIDLVRGVKLGLPSGQDVARSLGLAPLRPEQLGQAPGAIPESLRTATPLWFYLLKEAQITRSGRWLGSLGSRLVCEVIVGLLLADPHSFLNLQPDWEPEPPFGLERGQFTMADLIRIAGWQQLLESEEG